jgi:hypothetical protein
MVGMGEFATEGEFLPPGPSRDAPIHSIRSGIDRLWNELQHIPLMVAEVRNQRQMCIAFFFFVSR